MAPGTALRCLTYGGAGGGDHRLALGAIHLRHHAAVGPRCVVAGGCILPPFAEVPPGSYVTARNDTAFPICPETRFWPILLVANTKRNFRQPNPGITLQVKLCFLQMANSPS